VFRESSVASRWQTRRHSMVPDGALSTPGLPILVRVVRYDERMRSGTALLDDHDCSVGLAAWRW